MSHLACMQTLPLNTTLFKALSLITYPKDCSKLQCAHGDQDGTKAKTLDTKRSLNCPNDNFHPLLRGRETFFFAPEMPLCRSSTAYSFQNPHKRTRVVGV